MSYWLQTFGKALKLDMSQPNWRDRVAAEVSHAVLHSFANAGVTMVDHHQQAEQFMAHFK